MRDTEGEAILKSEGFPEKLWRFASHHTGVGLTRDVINQKLPLPEADYLVETDEELLVMYADKFHSKQLVKTFVVEEIVKAKGDSLTYFSPDFVFSRPNNYVVGAHVIGYFFVEAGFKSSNAVPGVIWIFYVV